MEMTYDGRLVMPTSFATMDEEEMTYVEGGFRAKSSTVAWWINVAWATVSLGFGLYGGISKLLRYRGRTYLVQSVKYLTRSAGISLGISAINGILSTILTVTNQSVGSVIVMGLNLIDKDRSNKWIQF